jgi:hypothetical protein
MKTALIWIMCMIVVAAAALVITDKVIELVAPQPKQEPAPAARVAGPMTAADPAVLERLEKVEAVLESIREMLKIPPPDQTETREDGPPPQAGIGERLQWIESEMSDLRRQVNRDLMQIFTRLRRRLDEMEAKLLKEGAPDSRATAADLKKLGVVYDADKNLITMEAAFVQPTRVLEFVAVGEGGSGHESLLLVNVKPSGLKRGLELMGVAEAADPPYDPKKLPKESCVYVYVSWPARATPIRVEKLLKHVHTGEQLPLTPFVFTASRAFVDPRTWEEHLAADVHKNVIALTWNYAGETVLACPDPAAADERAWAPAVDLVPEPPTPATLYVSREPRPEWEK